MAVPDWWPSWWPWVLVFVAWNAMVAAGGGLIVLITVRMGYTRQLLAQWAEPVGQQPAGAAVGRARVTNRNTGLAQTHLSARGFGLSDVPVSQPSVAGLGTYPVPLASAEAKGGNDYRNAAVRAVRETTPPAQLEPASAVDLDSLHDVYPDGDEGDQGDDEPDPPAGGGSGGGLEAAVRPQYQWGAGTPVAGRLTGGGLPYVLPHGYMLQAGRRVAAYLTDPIRIRCPDGVHHHRPGAKSLRKVFGHKPPPRPADRIGAHRAENAPGTPAQRWGLLA